MVPGSSTLRPHPMKSRLPLRSASDAAEVSAYTENVTVSKYGGQKWAAFAARVHDVAVDACSFQGPPPTGLLTLPDFTIGRRRPWPKTSPPADADDRVTVLPPPCDGQVGRHLACRFVLVIGINHIRSRLRRAVVER